MKGNQNQRKSLNARDKRLIELTSRFYLQYRGVDSFSKLSRILDKVDAMNLDDAQQVISAYLTYSALRTVNRAINSGLRDQWVRREYLSETGEDVYGILDVSRSLTTLPFNVAYLQPNLRSKELSFLAWIARETLRNAKDKLNYSAIEPFSFYHEMRREIKKAYERKKLLPEPSIPSIDENSPDWLRNSYRAYLISKRSKMGIKSRGGRKDVKIVISKLYELFVYMIVMKVLKEKGFTIKGKEGFMEGSLGNELLHLAFNVDPTSYGIKDLIESVDAMDEKFTKSVLGRPDLSIIKESERKRKLIIIECKYSLSPTYITEGRFKAMAYTYEFSSDATLLVFPGLLNRKAKQGEEESTIRIYEEMMKRKVNGQVVGWIDLKLRDGRKVYLVSIDPMEKMEENFERMKTVISSLI